MTLTTSVEAIYGYTVLMAIGVGAYNQAGYSVVQAKVRPDEIPFALGFMMVCKSSAHSFRLLIPQYICFTITFEVPQSFINGKLSLLE